MRDPGATPRQNPVLCVVPVLGFESRAWEWFNPGDDAMTPNQIAGRHAAQTQRLTPWHLHRKGYRVAIGFLPPRLGITSAADAVAYYRRMIPAAETWPLEARPGVPVVVPQKVDEVQP